MELAGADSSSGNPFFIDEGQGDRWVTYKVVSHSTADHWPQAGGVNCSLKIPRVWLRLTRKTETSLPIWGTDA